MKWPAAYPILTGWIALALWTWVVWDLGCRQHGVISWFPVAVIPAVVIAGLVTSRRAGDRWWGTVLWVVLSLLLTTAALLLALVLVIGHQGCLS